jgi:hypothetical protein
MEDPTRCKSTTPTPNGGRSSSMTDHTLSIGKMLSALMSQETRMRKVNQFKFTRDMMVRTRDGVSSILTKLRRSQLRDLTETSDSTETDHSTLSQDYQ